MMLTSMMLILSKKTHIIDSTKNWDTLMIKEALHIKLKKRVFNSGLKASKKLQLFN